MPTILGTGFDSREVTGFFLDLINIAKVIKDNTPTLEDEVVVEVVGQPGSNKQQLYYLAMATAFGIVRQYQILNTLLAFVTPSYGMIMSEDDAADNWVRFTLRYKVGMFGVMTQTAIGSLTGITGGIGGATSTFDQLTVYRGPQCNVNGGSFNFISTPLVSSGGLLPPVLTGSIPGIPTDPNSPAAPKLPFQGQPILTPCPTTVTPLPQPVKENPAPDYPTFLVGSVIDSPNPKPPGDNRSRGAVPVAATGAGVGFAGNSTTDHKGNCCAINLAIIPLVFAALSAPATNANMTFPNPTQGPTGN